MKKKFLNMFLLFTLSCSGQDSVKKALDNLPMVQENSPVPIMILGTFHFNYAENGSDVKGENNFDINSEKRQTELNDLIGQIKQFKPTKIAVEMMVTDQKILDSLFRAYSGGQWKPGRNEAYQLGFRLAKELGLKGVSCVDTRPPQIEIDTTVEDWEVYAQSRNELVKWQAYDGPNNRTNLYIETLKSQMTITDYLLFLNNEKTKLRYKQFFLTGLVDVGAGDAYVGADLTGYWYRRNTRIFSNIKKLAATSEEKILVIYGNSHAWILEELFEASPEFQVIKVEEILK